MPNEVVATLKGDGSAPWIVAHGDEVSEAERLIEDSLKGSFFQTVAEGSALFAGAVRIANGMAAPAEQPQQGSKPPYQPRQALGQNQAQQAAQGQQGFAGTPHPEGKTCPQCGAGLVGKQPKVKRMWTCPNQKQQGDGHYVEWING